MLGLGVSRWHHLNQNVDTVLYSDKNVSRRPISAIITERKIVNRQDDEGNWGRLETCLLSFLVSANLGATEFSLTASFEIGGKKWSVDLSENEGALLTTDNVHSVRLQRLLPSGRGHTDYRNA